MTGSEIRDIRRARGETQREFAVVMGVSQVTIAWWETGKKAPSPVNAGKLEELKNGRREV